MGVREGKNYGAKRNLPDFFGLYVPWLSKKFPETLSKLVADGGGGRSDYEKFLLDSIFPTKLTEFPTKFVPFIFIISQYCPTVKRTCPTGFVCPTNWWGGGGLPPPPPPFSWQRSPNLVLLVVEQNNIIKAARLIS
jgi:hypothetical protein